MDDQPALPLAPINRGLWGFAHVVAVAARPLMFRQTNRYLGEMPKDGPILLLGNHAALLDPVTIALGVSRPVHFMASEQLFRSPRLARLLTSLGTFPKAKYTRDPASIDRVVALHAAGRVIGLFPEGNRTWDGRLGPVLPGIGWLIKKIGGPVVFVRNFTGWMMQPRWAKYPRWVPMELEFSAPFVFPDDWSTTRIEEEIAARIAIDPTEARLAGWSFGARMAHGLPTYLWACPACLAIDSLMVARQNGDRVGCTACACSWQVDILQRLTPATGTDGTELMTVASAYDKITAHFGELPTMNAERFVADGLVLEDSHVTVSRVDDGLKSVTPLAEGAATMFADRLEVQGTRGIWTVSFDDIKAVSLEVGAALQLRTATDLLQLDTNSPVKWNHFLSRHVGRVRPTRRGRKR